MHAKDHNLLIVKALKSLNLGQTCTFHARHLSMYPLITPQDQITIYRTKISNIRQYDIIALYLDITKDIVVHRVVKIIKKKGKIILYTRGDNNNHIDEYTTTDKNFVGKVTKITKPTYTIDLKQSRYHFMRFHTQHRNFPKIKTIVLYLFKILP